MSQLPLKSPSDPITTRWKVLIDPLLANPLNNASILVGVQLAIGATVINHKLGRPMQGWMILDIDGAATVYRSAPMNHLTLTLTSDAAVTITLGVF